jgi:delta-aminolevulinic acid dehydratase/porphobilinogen synthase
MDTVCHIEIKKDGCDFIAKAHMVDGSIKEFRNLSFEDVITEMVIELQEELSD